MSFTCELNSLHYHSHKYATFSAHIYGALYFSLYQRAFLWVLSELTWVNLNFILCGNENDPFFKRHGNWYYIFAEFYLSFGNYLVKLLMYHTAKWLRKYWLLHQVSKDTRKRVN